MRKRVWVKYGSTWIVSNKVAVFLLLILTLGAAFSANAPALFIGRIINLLLSKTTNIHQLLIYVGLVIGFIFLNDGLLIVRTYVSMRSTIRFIKKLRLKMMASILHTSKENLDSLSRGEILQRNIDDLNYIQEFSVETIPQVVYQIISALIAVVLITSIDWPLALVGLFIYSIYLIPVRKYGKVQTSISSALSEHKALMNQSLLELLEQARLTKSYGKEKNERSRVKKLQNVWASLVEQKYTSYNKFLNFPRVLDALAPAFVFAFGGFQVFRGQMTIGDLVIIVNLLPRVNAPIRTFSTAFMELKNVGSKLRRIDEYIDLPLEAGLDPQLGKVESLAGHIQFKNISVEMDGKSILKNVSFSIKAREFVGFVGPTGSGKTTVLNLLTRMMEPTSGEIFIDGQPLSSFHSQDLRSMMGVISQEEYVFKGTVYDNLSYFKKITPDKMLNLLSEFGYDLSEHQLQKVIGREIQLSGGEKQKLTFIRTILKNPQILLIDEATSALDGESERAVMEIFNSEFLRKTTRLWVAHRLSTVVNADQILVFDKGSLVETGTHEQLLHKRGLYGRLWNRTGGEKNEA